MTKQEEIQDLKRRAQNKSLPASAVAALNKMIADLEKEDFKNREAETERKKEVEKKHFEKSKPEEKKTKAEDKNETKSDKKVGDTIKIKPSGMSAKIEEVLQYGYEVTSSNGRTMYVDFDFIDFESKKQPKSEDKKETSSKKIKLKEIKIHWAEGDNSKYDKFPKMYSTWSKSNDAIIPILKDNKSGFGYNKVKFTVFYEDGETYDGRLDVSETEDNPTKTHNVIGQHIKDFLDYELSEKSKSSAESKKEVKEWLEKYDLGLSSSKETVNSEDKKEAKSEETEEERCQKIIRDAKAASKKARESAKKSAKKPEVTKAKERIERTYEIIENKIEKGSLTKAEVAKLIVETKEVLKMLEKALKSL